MNRYESYVNTGSDWVPEIPEHWSLTRSKFIFRNKSIKNCPDEPLLSVTQKDGVVLRSESDLNVWNPTEDVSGYKLIEPSNFVISLRSFEGGLELSTVKGIVSPAYTVLEKIKKINDSYFRWLMKSHQFIIELNKHVTGIRQGKNIGWDDFSNIYLTVPPIEEQKLISRYLDKKTSQIDSLVEKIQKKIDLLKEQQTSLINHYVTKGLDPNVEMKDSGVEWIGEIPKHWITSRVKFLSETISKGTTPSTIGRELLDEGPIFYIKMSDFGLDKVNLPTSFIDFETNELLKRSSLYENDILFAITGEVGKTVIVNKEVVPSNTNQNISFVRLKNKKSVRYTWYWFSSDTLSSHLRTLYNVSTLPSLSMEDLGNLSILLPPDPEREQIVKFLDDQTQLIQEGIDMEDNRTELLKEYRQSLISSVVTGKVRVTEDMT